MEYWNIGKRKTPRKDLPVIQDLVQGLKMLFSVIPAPSQVRDKLQPESSVFEWLQILWPPVFTGVTTFYEIVKIQLFRFWSTHYSTFHYSNIPFSLVNWEGGEVLQ